MISSTRFSWSSRPTKRTVGSVRPSRTVVWYRSVSMPLDTGIAWVSPARCASRSTARGVGAVTTSAFA